MFELFSVPCDDEGHTTPTTTHELENEEKCVKYCLSDCCIHPEGLKKYLHNFITKKSPAGMANEQFCVWNPVYVLFPLRVLGFDTGEQFEELRSECEEYLARRVIESKGGISGFPQDNFHTVTNYAALTGIALVGTETAYELIDRQAFYKELLALKLENGAFSSTRGHEYDVRSTFTAIMMASFLNMLTPELTRGVREFAKKCQGYDGGIAPRPGLESHGGYVHCGVGVLYLLDALDDLDLPALIRWISMRQMDWTGGFNGRPNKIVDSCYSWWMGTACQIISRHLNIPPFWNENAMALYLLRIAQKESGAFCDHPPSGQDKFHTMYSIAGLGLCGGGETGVPDLKLKEIDLVMTCTKELADKMRAYFKARPFIPE